MIRRLLEIYLLGQKRCDNLDQHIWGRWYISEFEEDSDWQFRSCLVCGLTQRRALAVAAEMVKP